MKNKENVKKLTAVVLATQMAVSMVPVYAQEGLIAGDQVLTDEGNQIEETLPEEEVQTNVEENEQLDETTESDVVDEETNDEASENNLMSEEVQSTEEEKVEAPVTTNEIYVSQNGSGDGTQENPKSFETAMNEAKDGDVFVIIGQINLPEGWETPACSITITGADKETSVLRMAIGGTSKTDSASMSLEGNLTLDNLMLDVVENSNPYFDSMFVIVANGHKFVIESGVYTKENPLKYIGKIFGGGFHSDVTGDTYVENKGSLLVTDIYGGGCAGNVTGNTNVIVTGLGRKIYGGGLSVYGSTNTANVTGDTNISLQNAQLTSRPVVYGGGDGSDADAIVNGNVTIYHDNVKDGGKIIYGAGNASEGNAYVGGNVSIVVKNYDMANNNSIIYGGGHGSKQEKSAGVKGDVNITYENGNFGTIYGAGYKYADVDGKTTITLKNNKGTPVVYGGGQGNKTYQVQSHKDVEINLLNSKVDLYTQGVNAKVHGLVSVNLLGGGADRANNSVGYNLYNRMRLSSSNGSDKGEPSEDFKATVNVLDGDNIVTTINDFANVNIQKGSLLEHVRYYDGSGTAGDGPRKLFNNVGNVNIQTEGCLDLLGDNEINGSFTSSGNLTTVSGTKLIVDGNVTSSEGASYTSSDFEDIYTNSYPFLQMKGQENKDATFKSTDPTYTVKHRDGKTSDIIQEWYLDVEKRTVTFNSNGGSNVETQTVKYNEKAIKPEDPIKEGYVFAGWYKDDKLTELYDFESLVTENTILYAKWNLKESELNVVPTIKAEDKTITVGDTFDPMTGVTASDKEDGDLTSKVKVIENTVDTSKPETYKVIYEVTDSMGAKATKTISVTVNPKTEVINAIPTIKAEDKTITVGDTFDPMTGVTASDKEDGDLTSKVKVILNTVDTTKPGNYLVTYKVTDSVGLSTSKTITVIVKEEVKTPVDENKTDDKDKGTNTGLSTGVGVGLFASLGTTALSSMGILEILRRKNRK